MQYDPRQSPTPPKPIEPTGFFTGIQLRPIVMGVVVDFVATLAMTMAYFNYYVAKELAEKGLTGDDAFGQYWASSEGLVASLVIGSLGTAIGGFYAAYKAGALEMKHGALVGIGSIVLGLLMSLVEGESQLPEWFLGLSAAAAIPAGALGGFFAEMYKNLSGRPPRVGGGLPRAS
jgi:putative membrane protein (TIGR04086 family)